MNKKQKLFSFTLFGILMLGLVGFLSPTCPFTPLSSWLENLFSEKDSCICLCPWWLFLLFLISSSWLLLLRFFRMAKVKSQAGYWAGLTGLGLLTFVLHLVAHNFYISRGVFEASLFCKWFWLMDAAIVFIFGLFKIRKTD